MKARSKVWFKEFKTSKDARDYVLTATIADMRNDYYIFTNDNFSKFVVVRDRKLAVQLAQRHFHEITSQNGE